MLGRLFSNLPASLTPASPSTTRPNSSLESVQEDIHTRNLLYPDAEALYQHQHDQVFPLHTSAPLLGSSLNNYDLNTDIELDLKDVRMVIMQEATSYSNSAALMYDSHALPEVDRRDTPTPPQQTGTSRSVTSPRRVSLGQTSKPVVITQERESAFGRRPSTHIRAASYAETEGQRSAREYREEINTFSSCIFGSSDIMSYKGTGTKMHIIPTESKSVTFEGQGSLGRSSMKTSRLAQSYTSESLHTPISATFSKSVDKKKVLITRIFPVPLPFNEDDSNGDGYPFPAVGNEGKSQKPKQQKRTPMYAIGLIIQLPQTNGGAASKSYFRGPGSYSEQESSPSSYSSLKPTGWTMLGDGFGVESLESSLMSEVDDRLDLISHHWEVIKRTLSHLQAVVSKDVLAMLRQVDVASPAPMHSNGHLRSGSVSIAGKRVDEVVKPFKPAGSNAKLVQLPPNSMARKNNIKSQVDASRLRILNGIKTFQVVTRQGRWGIWREEARWVSKWAGGKEEGFFFYNLLTAFLGTHTEWLEALAPSWYKRRRYQQKRFERESLEDVPLCARTVVVANSQDKMAARRLVFLLSAFLSPNQQHLQQQQQSYRSFRPGTATSFGGHSQSPPSYLPIREESLRRRVNKKKSHSRTISFPAQSIQVHERRNSDLRTANLPIPGTNEGSRKSSAATTTTVTPVTTVPHFATRRTRGTGPLARPGSSGSLVADDLIRTLKRDDSSGQWSNNSSDSQSRSRWGSMSSWSTKGLEFWRRGSTAATDVSPLDEEQEPQRGKLAEMVEEAQRQGCGKSKYTISEQGVEAPLSLAAYHSPVKTSIDEDGVIDIEVPMPDLFSSFGSVVSSPSSSGYLSNHIGHGLEGFEHFSHGNGDPPLNVGGWLPQYHPDFALQAIPKQDNLEEAVKASMRAEPTPTINYSHGESRWVDITSALIADTTKFTIKRIRYRRHIKMRAEPDASDDARSQSTASIYGNPYSAVAQTPSIDAILDDCFEEEMVMALDETLIEAVERIIAQPAPVPSTDTTTSSASSASHIEAGGRETSDETILETKDEMTGTATAAPDGEVPRAGCKKWILSALEGIAKSVCDSRQEPAGPDICNGRKTRGDNVAEESFLREGIRSWLGSVEEGS